MSSYNHLTIINPQGKEYYSGVKDEIAAAYNLAAHSLKGEIVVTKDLSNLERVINDYKDQSIGLVGIFSGDGGVMYVRTAIENVWGYRPAYALFPGGTQVNIQRTVGLKKSKTSITSYARYIAQKASLGNLDHATISIPSLDVNGKKGFNAGVGLVPKLLWMYYGRSAEQYAALERELRTVDPSEYLEAYEKILGQDQPERKVKDELTGLTGISKTIWKTVRGIRKAHSFENYIFSTPIRGRIIVDGKEQSTKKPLGLYVSCYEEVNFGFSFLNPRPSPEARAELDKFQVVAPYGRPLDIARQLPRVIAGKHLNQAAYFHASTLEVPSEKIIELDGEIILGQGFTIKSDGMVKIVSPLAER